MNTQAALCFVLENFSNQVFGRRQDSMTLRLRCVLYLKISQTKSSAGGRTP